MNVLNNSNDEVAECPLCMEPLEVDDLNFYPCTCGYQICRFCWHRIRTDENELCPACRKEYPENPADFTPLTQEEVHAYRKTKGYRQRRQNLNNKVEKLTHDSNFDWMIAFKSQKRQRDQQRKQKITENRKHLANVRVVQKNLVFVVGLPPRLADADILKKHEYFGKYGKIHKVVINPSTTYAGVQEMHQGKHQEYEKRLHDALIATFGVSTATGIGPETSTKGGAGAAPAPLVVVCGSGGGVSTVNSKGGSGDISNTKAGNAILALTTTPSAMSSSASSSSSSINNGTTAAVTVGGGGAGGGQRDAWPSLSVSPVNSKESSGGGTSNGKNRKERSKHEKTRNERSVKIKGNKSNSYNNQNNCNSNSINKENNHPQMHSSNNDSKDTTIAVDVVLPSSECITVAASEPNSNNKSKTEKNKEKLSLNRQHCNKDHQAQEIEKCLLSADEEVTLIEDSEKRNGNSNKGGSSINKHSSNIINCDGIATLNDEQRSLSSSSNGSTSSCSNSNSSDRTSTLSESTSGKSSPESSHPNITDEASSSITTAAAFSNDEQVANIELLKASVSDCSNSAENSQNSQLSNVADFTNGELIGTEVSNSIKSVGCNDSDTISNAISKNSFLGNGELLPTTNTSEMEMSNILGDINNIDTTAAMSKLNLFDDNNSFFSTSSAASFQHSLKNKIGSETRQNQMNSAIISHLPDLLNGIDGFQNNGTNTNEWEEAFKNVMIRNSKQMEEQFQQQQHHQLQLQQQEEFVRMQELQTRNSLLNNIGLSQLNGPHHDFANIATNFHGSTDLSRLTQQQSAHPSEHGMGNNLFGTNMSKFFDFHKNQQMHQQFLNNGQQYGGSGNNSLSEHMRMASLLENNRINSQFLDQTNGLTPQHQHLQKQRLLGKFDPMQQSPSQNMQQTTQQEASPQLQHTQTNRVPSQFLKSSSVDDDLGFDPFTETQKALAELMENEIVLQQNSNTANSNTTIMGAKIQPQHNSIDNMQRPRNPPPGFNHMNAFGFGVPRAQNTSKILPFINMTGNCAAAGGQSPHQQTQMQMPNSWNPHLATFQQQQQSLGDQQMLQTNPNINGGNLSRGYTNNDWTAMDPAILSFRQFSSFPQQPQMQHSSHPHQQDMFMQHLTQHQNIQGFGSANLPAALPNAPQPSQAQMNFPHSNWLNNEQSLFMNSLANGFTNNSTNFDKFSVPMPPGINPNNLNKQQKTECIN